MKTITYEIYKAGQVYYLIHLDDTPTKCFIGERPVFAASSPMPEVIRFNSELLEDLITTYIGQQWMLSNYAHRKIHVEGFVDGIRYAINNMNGTIKIESLLAEIEAEQYIINDKTLILPKIRNGHINIVKVKR
jgi:hypothetical protein